MKLATYQHPGGSPLVGIVIADRIVDIAAAAPELPRDMVGLVRAGAAVRERLNWATSVGRPIPLEQVRLMAPILSPPELLGVGLNYRDHVAEAGFSVPTIPTIFNKQTSSIVGPYDDVVRPNSSEQLDYEGELGIVIGKAARHLSVTAAASAIFGYVVINDFSVRDWQFLSSTHTLGKSFDTHGPFGPWIVTADEISDVRALELTTRVNGEVRQSASIDDMIFDCRAIVEFLSRVMTLQPGTVIATGTPAGVGLCRKPAEFLRVGDSVTVEISGIGRLTNRIVAEGEPGG